MRYGLAKKEEIMMGVADAVARVPGIAFYDFQRAYDSGIGPEKMPGCFVNDVIEMKERRIVRDIYKNNLQVGVVAWVRASETENLWTKLNEFVQAIVRAVLVDATLRDKTYSVRPVQIETDAGSRHPIGVAVVIFEAIYFSET